MASEFFVMSPAAMRDAYLRNVRVELIRRGVANPNVLPESDYYVRASALAQQLSPCMANAVTAAEINMPDKCTGERLLRWLAAYGLAYLPAQPSTGNVVYSASASGWVDVGTQLVDDKGQFYQVNTAATYANGDLIPITAISTGVATNRTEGTVLQWVRPPTYANPKATVATGGLSDGADADTDDTARARLLDRLRRAQGGGNWAQTITWAESVIAGTTAFDYPALNGPATYALWVLGQLRYTGSRFTRQLSDVARTQIGNYVKAQKPTETALTMPSLGSNVVDIGVDASIALALPEATTAGGTGGGWTDASPWPALTTGATRCVVVTVTDATHLILSSAASGGAPDPDGIIDGSTRIAWFNPAGYGTSSGVIRTSTVIAHSGSAGYVSITLDPAHPFTGIQVADWIFPACDNAEAYAQAWLASVGAMGPGEWTSNATVLAWARRRPLATQEYPHTLSYQQTRAIEQSGSEVLNASYLYSSLSTPTIPSDTTTVAPYVFVPGRRLAFYPPQ